MTPATASSYFPLADANGNALTYSDAAGNVQAHYVYDAFGGTVSSDGDMADAFRFRFSSKYLDDETGFYYYGYRYYVPALGRWLNRDPIEENGGWNIYVAVYNNPITEVDVLGLHWWGLFHSHDKDKECCEEDKEPPEWITTLVNNVTDITKEIPAKEAKIAAALIRGISALAGLKCADETKASDACQQFGRLLEPRSCINCCFQLVSMGGPEVAALTEKACMNLCNEYFDIPDILRDKQRKKE